MICIRIIVSTCFTLPTSNLWNLNFRGRIPAPACCLTLPGIFLSSGFSKASEFVFSNISAIFSSLYPYHFRHQKIDDNNLSANASSYMLYNTVWCSQHPFPGYFLPESFNYYFSYYRINQNFPAENVRTSMSRPRCDWPLIMFLSSLCQGLSDQFRSEYTAPLFQTFFFLYSCHLIPVHLPWGSS